MTERLMGMDDLDRVEWEDEAGRRHAFMSGSMMCLKWEGGWQYRLIFALFWIRQINVEKKIVHWNSWVNDVDVIV